MNSPFSSESLLTCLTTTWESQWITIEDALATLTKSMPARSALYSALLFIVCN